MYAIEVNNLSKIYRMYQRPSDRLKEALLRRPYHQPFEALRAVSFAVTSGGTIGVMGENGAGKSTLLKILAGTLTPSSGEVILQGRASALLELGAGFHQEFTGRQNIYLNASLQGFSKSEIREKESAIIDFAGIGGFIDRPLKTYSSGMMMRLAFSIATSVDPDVLIIDEALAVGDQRFQQKCVNRMMDFRRAGKTIVFCSHSMYLINELCAESLWLKSGEVCGYGRTSEVVSEYLAYLETAEQGDPAPAEPVQLEDSDRLDITIEDIRLFEDGKLVVERIEQFRNVVVQVKTRRAGLPMKGHLGIGFERPDGDLVFGAMTNRSGLEPIEFSGDQVIELEIPSMHLLRGSYRTKALIADEHTLRAIHEHITPPFTIKSDRPELGMLWMEHHWRIPDERRGS